MDLLGPGETGVDVQHFLERFNRPENERERDRRTEGERRMRRIKWRIRETGGNEKEKEPRQFISERGGEITEV